MIIKSIEEVADALLQVQERQGTDYLSGLSRRTLLRVKKLGRVSSKNYRKMIQMYLIHSDNL